MKYDHHDQDHAHDETNLFDGLEALTAGGNKTWLPSEGEHELGIAKQVGDALNTRFDLDIDCWAPRCA